MAWPPLPLDDPTMLVKAEVDKGGTRVHLMTRASGPFSYLIPHSVMAQEDVLREAGDCQNVRVHLTFNGAVVVGARFERLS